MLMYSKKNKEESAGRQRASACVYNQPGYELERMKSTGRLDKGEGA